MRLVLKIIVLPLLAGLVVLPAFAGAAFAASPWSVFVEAGLAGRWAISCTAAPGNQNPWMIYYEGDNGTVRRKLDRGPGTGNYNLTIDSASIEDDGTVRASMRNDDPVWGDSNGTVAIVVVKIADGHAHTLQSASPDGEQFIKDGIVLGNGAPSPSFEKCPN
jgi:hypothetical protein